MTDALFFFAMMVHKSEHFHRGYIMALEFLNGYQSQVFARALDVWDSQEDAEAFMTTPHSLLNGKTPLETSLTNDGAEKVESILHSIFWGLPR